MAHVKKYGGVHFPEWLSEPCSPAPQAGGPCHGPSKQESTMRRPEEFQDNSLRILQPLYVDITLGLQLPK